MNEINLKSEHALSKPHKKKSAMVLIDEGYLNLKSRIARYYFYMGGDKNGISINYFAQLLYPIWLAASQDDPYADLFLLRIYDALVSLKREIRQQTQHYREILQKEISFEWKIGLSDKPQKIRLYFKLPYGFMAANLMADFDEFACVIYSSKMLGIVLDKGISELLTPIGDKIKQLLELPLKWQSTGVTRLDIQQQTDKAKQAFELMGVLNPQVLERQLRAPHAPKIKTLFLQEKISTDSVDSVDLKNIIITAPDEIIDDL